MEKTCHLCLAQGKDRSRVRYLNEPRNWMDLDPKPSTMVLSHGQPGGFVGGWEQPCPPAVTISLIHDSSSKADGRQFLWFLANDTSTSQHCETVGSLPRYHPCIISGCHLSHPSLPCFSHDPMFVFPCRRPDPSPLLFLPARPSRNIIKRGGGGRGGAADPCSSMFTHARPCSSRPTGPQLITVPPECHRLRDLRAHREPSG